LFLELQLDDRFISENDFWDAIIEHPALINGPVLATATRAAVCQSESALESFLSDTSLAGSQTTPKLKKLSERALRMLAGDLVLPLAANENLAASVASRPANDGPPRPESAPEAIVIVRRKPVAKLKAAPKRKSTTKTKVTAKKSGGKPVKKSVRAVAPKRRKQASQRKDCS
jgi:hypothetical protein